MSDNQQAFANPLLERSAFDSDAESDMVLCVIPSEGYPVRFVVPAIYMELVQKFNGQRTEDGAIAAFLDDHPGSFEREWLKRLVHQSLFPKGILVRADQDPARVVVSSQPKRGLLFLKLPIIPAQIVDVIAKNLRFMYSRIATSIFLALFVWTHIYIYTEIFEQNGINANNLAIRDVLILMVVSTFATLFHEFGHASAAARFGCKSMTIGWGVYIIYTVLWTDVSDAWRLPRHQRAIVDISGVYFEGIFAIAVSFFYIYTNNNVFLIAIMFINISMVYNFNPFLKMDGYWLMSDLFGIVNLRSQQWAWIQNMVSRFFGSAVSTSDNLRPRAKLALAIYSGVGSIAFIYFMFLFFKFVVFSVAAGYPELVVKYWENLFAGLSFIALLEGFLEILWRTIVLAGAAVSIFGVFKRGVDIVAKAGLLRAAARQSSV